MTVTMKEEILEVTTMVGRTVRVSGIIVDSSHQVTDAVNELNLNVEQFSLLKSDGQREQSES